MLCWERPLYRHLLFALSTILTICIMGYHFGTFDQAIHIPFLKKFSDPTLFPNDHFFDLRFIHVSFFWFFFIPFYRIGLLEISMFLVYVAVIYATFWAVWKLSKTLFQNPYVSFLSVITFILPHVGFGMLPLIEFSLLNRTFVLPFLLLSLDLYLRKRYLTTYFLLGILYNFHVVSVNFVLAMVLFDSILRIWEIGWKKVVSSMVLFVIAALPVLIWKMKVAPVDFSIQKQWYEIISKGILYHLFAILPLNPLLLMLTISGIGTIMLFFIGKHLHKSSALDRTITHFVMAVLIILAVEFVTSEWLPVAIIMESQIIRAGLFVLLFGYLYFINGLVTTYFKEGVDNGAKFFFMFLVVLLSVSPMTLVIVWLIHRRYSSITWLKIMTFCACIFFVSSLFIVSQLQIWYPGIHIFAKKGPDYDVQMWARNHTNKDDVFITPPQWWWFYNLEWRVVSERSTVVTLFDLAEAAFSPEYIKYWIPRFQAVAPGILNRFNGNVFESRKMTAEAFYSLSPQQFIDISHQYHAHYLVVEKPHSYPFHLVYENSIFLVYQLFQ